MRPYMAYDHTSPDSTGGTTTAAASRPTMPTAAAPANLRGAAVHLHGPLHGPVQEPCRIRATPVQARARSPRPAASDARPPITRTAAMARTETHSPAHASLSRVCVPRMALPPRGRLVRRRVRRPDGRLLLEPAPALVPHVSRDDLKGSRRRDRDQGAHDPAHPGPDEHGEQDPQRVQADGAAHDDRVQDVVL